MKIDPPRIVTAGALLQGATIETIKQNVQRLKESTPIRCQAVQGGGLKVVGGLYHLKTDRVAIVCIRD